MTRDYESMVNGIREAHGEVPKKASPTAANPTVKIVRAESIYEWANLPRCASCGWPHRDRQPRCAWCASHNAYALTNHRKRLGLSYSE
jgi:hypothetical protein